MRAEVEVNNKFDAKGSHIICHSSYLSATLGYQSFGTSILGFLTESEPIKVIFSFISWCKIVNKVVLSLAILASALLAVSYITPDQRITLAGDTLLGQQLYNGVLYAASPDWTPVPDVPCIVTYTPDQGLLESCYSSLLSSGGIIEDLRVIGYSLYAAGRGDTSYGNLDSVYLLEYDGSWSIVATLSKYYWGYPYIQNMFTEMAPLSNGNVAMLVELLNDWAPYSIEDVRLVILDTDGNLLNDIDVGPYLNLDVNYIYYTMAGNGDYVLIAQVWQDDLYDASSPVHYKVLVVNTDTGDVSVLDQGTLYDAYFIAAARIYNLNGGSNEYVAIYYLEDDGTLTLKVYGPDGEVFTFTKTLPFDIVNAIPDYTCIGAQMKVAQVFLASDDGGFYIPITVEIDDGGTYKWVNALVGSSDVYVFDNEEESWGFSLARVSSWGEVIVGGTEYCGTGYAYALPDPGDPITLSGQPQTTPQTSVITTTVTKTTTIISVELSNTTITRTVTTTLTTLLPTTIYLPNSTTTSYVTTTSTVVLNQTVYLPTVISVTHTVISTTVKTVTTTMKETVVKTIAMPALLAFMISYLRKRRK